jgi:hypothetical protein
MADLARAARSFRPRLLLPELRNVVLPVRLIEHPHFGQTVLSDAITFSRLIFCFWGMLQPWHRAYSSDCPSLLLERGS